MNLFVTAWFMAASFSFIPTVDSGNSAILSTQAAECSEITRLSESYLDMLAAIAAYFSLLAVCFRLSTLTKATVYLISLAARECNQSFLIHDTSQ